jgi:antitoxin (DNA-binding transcriptional repressor) of toxin-antitoxin stability system
MNETVLTIEDAARCLPELVEQVHASGRSALLVKSGQPLARLVPLPSREHDTAGLVAFLRQWRIEYPDPDDGLAESIAESRGAVRSPQNPWE